jgi:hypothetical protein
VCVHTVGGPHGALHVFVYATTKKLTEKTVLKMLLESRGRGMPLLVLCTEDVPAKVQEFIDDTPNAYVKKL